MEATTTLQFEEAEITLAGPFALKTYPGKVAVGTGIGYWIDEKLGEDNAFQPTHIQSGYGVCAYALLDEQVAQLFLEQIAPLMDWNCSLEELVADPAYQDVVQKIKDITLDLVAQYPGAFGARW